MQTTKSPRDSENPGVFQLLVLILSIYAMLALLADTFLTLHPEVSLLIQIFDLGVCAVFLIDFSLRFYRAERKLAFMKTGWVDLLASIPTVEFLRWGRPLRVLQIIRIWRAARATHKILLLVRSRQSAAGSVGLIAVLLILFSSLGILIAERAPEANIKTAEDAIWWSFTTITTVGYGDRYPISPEGRFIAIILMVCGVGLFGSFTAVIAGYFTGQNSQRDTSDSELLLQEIRKLQQQVALLQGGPPGNKTG